MHCNTAREQLGTYLDGELSADLRSSLETHLRGCATCAQELESLKELVSGLSVHEPARVPEALWASIEGRLEQRADRSRTAPRLPGFRWPAAIAASLVVAVCLGLLGLLWSDGPFGRAEASVIDFGILLDGLALDPERAFRDFLERYEARQIAPSAAASHAPTLSFALPEELPGGFGLQVVYVLRFGDSPGVAAKYSRNGELLATVFHRPVQREHFGTHKDLPCVVGPHRGHMVAVGEWTMVHLTDPTTCHCVLSKLDEQAELPAVMAAISPGAAGRAED